MKVNLLPRLWTRTAVRSRDYDGATKESSSYFSRISLLLVTCCWFGISRLSLLYSPLLAAWSSCFASPSDFASSGIFLGPQTSRAAIIAPIMTTSHGSIKDMIGPVDLSCLAYDFLVHIIQTRMVRYDQVRSYLSM